MQVPTEDVPFWRCQVLLDHGGSDLCAQDDSGWSPIFYAAEGGHVEVHKSLEFPHHLAWLALVLLTFSVSVACPLCGLPSL